MYATKQDLIDRYGATELIQLTDRVNRPASTIDDTVVDRALADAAALADGYLSAAEILPLAAVPPALTRVVCDIARYFLHGKSAEKDGPVDRANTAALRWLQDVSKGIVRLVDAGGDPAPITGTGDVRTNVRTRVMDRDSLRGL